MVVCNTYITMGLTAHSNGHMQYIYNHGPGLIPDPVCTPIHIISNSNKIKCIYMLSNTCGCTGWVALPKALPCSKVTGSTPANNIIFKLIYRWHMEAIDWAMCCYPIHCKQATSYANCPHNCLPLIVWPLPRVVRPATSTSVQTVQSASLFFVCLSFWTEHDISRSWCPFEPKWVVLSS
jgi:hypothetical protein